MLELTLILVLMKNQHSAAVELKIEKKENNCFSKWLADSLSAHLSIMWVTSQHCFKILPTGITVSFSFIMPPGSV